MLSCQSKQKLPNFVKERLLTKCKRDRGMQWITYRTSWCKLLAEHRLEKIPKRQSLFRFTNKFSLSQYENCQKHIYVSKLKQCKTWAKHPEIKRKEETK